MPNTVPVNDCREVTERIVERARQVGRVRVHPVAAISRGLKGELLCDFASLREAGAVAVSDDGRGLMNAGLMRRALEQASRAGLLVIQHCEDPQLSGGGAVTEGPVSERSGLSAQPVQAESVVVARDLELVELTGARYHVAHISCAASLRLVKAAKARGLPVSCEVTPHHLSLTEEACLSGDPSSKVNPPLRSEADRQALLEALADGTVDVIATDHAPHSAEDKRLDYEKAAFGISGLETALALSLELWRGGVLPLADLVAVLTCTPARLLGIEAGSLAVGAPADIAVVDLDRAWTVDPARFHSRGRNTPFAGWKLTGLVTCTVCRGEVVHEV
jgi:dihydroorotase